MIFYSPSTGGFYVDDIHDLIPGDAVEIDEAAHESLLNGQLAGKQISPGPGGFPILLDPPAPTEAEVIAAIASRVQTHLDQTARSIGYDDIKTAVTYADEPSVPKFQQEGQALRAWRSLVWAKCYELLDEVNAGTRSAMTTEEIIAELPEFKLL